MKTAVKKIDRKRGNLKIGELKKNEEYLKKRIEGEYEIFKMRLEREWEIVKKENLRRMKNI